MSALNIQGISSYQMRLQSYSSKINELSKNHDSSSISMASSLRQQYAYMQSNLAAAVSSNNSVIMKQNEEKESLERYIYNRDAKKEQISNVSFETSA